MAKEYHPAPAETIPSRSENQPVIGHAPPQDHYSTTSGEWDGQLPHAELVHDATPDYSGYPGPVDRRKWATGIGIAFGLSGTERSILQSYAHDAGTPQGCWKSAATMAYELGHHEKSIRDARDKFLELGILQDAGRRNRARRLTLNFDVTGPDTRLQPDSAESKPGVTPGYNDVTGEVTGCDTRIDRNVTGPDARLQPDSNEINPGLTPGYNNVTGCQARINPGLTPGKVEVSRNSERDNNNKSLSFPSTSNSGSPGLTPGFRARSPTHDEDPIEALVNENWTLLQEAGWGFLGGAIKHYKRYGLDYLRNDLDQKRKELERASLVARTCVHCRTVHDSTDQVKPCVRCDDPICVSEVSSCRQHTCFRKQGAVQGRSQRA